MAREFSFFLDNRELIVYSRDVFRHTVLSHPFNVNISLIFKGERWWFSKYRFLLQGLPFVQFTLNKGLRSHEIISLLGCLVNGRIRVLIYAAINVNLLGGNAGNGWGFDGEIQNDQNFCSLVKSPPLTHTLPSLWVYIFRCITHLKVAKCLISWKFLHFTNEKSPFE